MSSSPAAGSPGPLPPSGPPYLPPVAQSGGVPTTLPDDPVSAVLLALFVGSAILHMAIFQVNLHRSHKFVFSVLLFGFSMARITALAMRLAWSQHSSNVSVAIAAAIFTAAGVLLLFLVNLLFAQRILRAYHPRFGWLPPVRWAFHALFVSVVAVLVMIITASVHLFFTLDAAARARDRTVQLVATTYLAVMAFLPIPIVLVARATAPRVRDKFGAGSFRAKMALLLGTSALLTLGAAFRAGTAFLPPRPATDPAWYHSKAAYYCFNYVIEIIVTYAYGLARFDRRFHVPDGSKAAGDYSAKATGGAGDRKAGSIGGFRVNDEEEVFGPAEKEVDAEGDETSGGEGERAKRGERGEGASSGEEWEERYPHAGRKSESVDVEKKAGDGRQDTP